MNSESSKFQQNSKFKKGSNYLYGPYTQNKPLKKFHGKKYNASPNFSEGQSRPRFQSDEGFNNYNENWFPGEFYQTPPPTFQEYGYTNQSHNMNHHINAYSSGAKRGKRFRQGMPNANNLLPHKLKFPEDNISERHRIGVHPVTNFAVNSQFLHGTKLNFVGSQE